MREFPFCTTLSLHDVTTRCTAVSKTVQFPQNVQKSDAVLGVFCDPCFSSRESHDSEASKVNTLQGMESAKVAADELHCSDTDE